MMDILGLLELQGRLFLLMGVGMFLRRSLLSEAFQKGLTDLIVDLILPCSILTAFGTEPREDLLRSVLFTLPAARTQMEGRPTEEPTTWG